MAWSGLRSWSPFLLLPFLHAACSDDDPDGSGGTSGVGAGKQHTSAATAIAPGDLCEAFCRSTGNCFVDCVATCQDYQDPPCQAEGFAYIECLANDYDAISCAANSCGSQFSTMLACRTAAPVDCQPEVCGGNESTCTCSRDCTGGLQQASCITQAGHAQCSCYLAGILLATVSGPAEVTQCSFASSTCAYAIGGGP